MNEIDRTNEIIKTEYLRLCRERNRSVQTTEKLPHGYISKKKIKGREYFYLQHKEEGKVVSKYISLDMIDTVADNIKKRKYLTEYIKQLNEKLEKMEKLTDIDKNDPRKKELYSVDEIKEILKPEFERYDVRKAVLFGSYAKCKADEHSDIDIMVETGLRGMQFFGLLDAVSNALVVAVDLIEKREIVPHSPLEEEILKTGILIYG